MKIIFLAGWLVLSTSVTWAQYGSEHYPDQVYNPPTIEPIEPWNTPAPIPNGIIQPPSDPVENIAGKQRRAMDYYNTFGNVQTQRDRLREEQRANNRQRRQSDGF